jgi:Flp pilus assembly protein TadG
LKEEDEMRPRRPSDRRRRGSNLVETAVVLPVSLMLIIGTYVMGLGFFRYHQVATLAREGARYASVHGSQYATVTNNSAMTAANIYTNAILPMAVGLNTSNLIYTIQWGTKASGSWVWTSWDSSKTDPISPIPNSSPANQPIYNSVKVTVSYQWTPEMYITGPITLSSTSEMPMSF